MKRLLFLLLPALFKRKRKLKDKCLIQAIEDTEYVFEYETEVNIDEVASYLAAQYQYLKDTKGD